MAVQHISGLTRALSEAGQPIGDYTPRSILVTGGAGFIASHVVLRLVNRYPDCKVGGPAFWVVSLCCWCQV